MSKGKLLVAVLVVLVLGAGGYSVWQRLAEPELPAGIVSANGRIEAERIDVSSKIAGRVADASLSCTWASAAWRRSASLGGMRMSNGVSGASMRRCDTSEGT